MVKWYQEDNWYDDTSNQHCLLCKVTYDNNFNTLDYIIFDAIVKRTTKDKVIFIIQDIMHTMKECEENNNMFEYDLCDEVPSEFIFSKGGVCCGIERKAI